MNYRPGENNYNFKILLNRNENSSDPVWQEVLDRLRSGRENWKIIKKEITPCRHPGVRDKGNRCVFCLIEKRNLSEMASHQDEEQAKKAHIDALLNKANKLDTEAAMLRVEAMEVESGVRAWTKNITRQEAVAAGLKWYTSVNPCRHCGVIAEKYVANGRCRNCGK